MMTDDEMNELILLRDRMESLLKQIDDPLFFKFFDYESNEMLSEKIRVLEQLSSGKKPIEIPLYYKVLELYPKNETRWDY